MHSSTAMYRLLMLLAAAAVLPWAVAIAFAGTAFAGDMTLVGPGNSEHARAELLVGVDSISPVTPFPVGVRLTMDPGWHVYWKYPGTAGLPTTVDFHLPDGYTVGPLQYPTPAEFDQPGGIVGYGYEKSVLLTATVTPPADVKVGQSVTISADVSWLVCEAVCIPGGVTLEAALPVGSGVRPATVDPTFDADVAPTDASADPAIGSVETGGSLADGSLNVTVRWARPPKDQTSIRWIPAVPDGLIAERASVEPSADPAVTAARFTFEVYDHAAADAAVAANGGVIDTVLTYTGDDGKRQGVAIPVPLNPASPIPAP